MTMLRHITCIALPLLLWALHLPCAHAQHLSDGHMLMAPVKADGKWGYIDQTGNFVVLPEFDFATEFAEGLAVVQKRGLWGFVNSVGEFVIPPQYEDAYSFSDGMARVKLKGQWGYINNGGEFVIEARYDHADDFSEGFAVVVSDGKFGYINTRGEWMIAPQFNDAFDFSEGLALVNFEGKWGYINKQNYFAVEPRFENASYTFNEGLAMVQVGGKRGFINARGDYAIPPTFDDAGQFSEGLAPVSMQGAYGYIAPDGGAATEFRFQDARHFSEGMAAVKYDGVYGFINPSGGFVVSPRFEDAKPFENGMAKVVYAGKYGFIKPSGSFVISPDFDWAFDFSEGLAAVERQGLFGFIDQNGRYLIQPNFEDAGSFKEVPVVAEKPVITQISAVPTSYDGLEASNYKLTAIIRSREPLIECMLLVNDRSYDVNNSKGTLIQPIKRQNEFTLEVETSVPLSEGNNQVYLKAINRNGKTLSEPIFINYVARVVTEKPDLYVLSVGISEFGAKGYDLKFADIDALDFSDAFTSQKNLPFGQRLFDEIEVQTLTNGQATTANIQKAVMDIKKRVSANDLFVFMISSHGELDSYGDFYIRTHDADPGIDYLSITALPNAWLAQQIRDFDCTVIQFFDACHSGEAGSDLAMKGATDTEIAVRELKSSLQNKALYFFASSSSRQASQERREWRNGAFTEAIISCLKGESFTDFNGQPVNSDYNNDGFINTMELGNYINRAVKVLTNGQQTPKATIENGEPINIFVIGR